MPAVSTDRSAPRAARNVPTAEMVGCQSCTFAAMVDTVCGGRVPGFMNFAIMMPLKIWKPNSKPPTTPTTANTMMTRLVVIFMTQSLSCGVSALFSLCRAGVGRFLFPRFPPAAKGDEQCRRIGEAAGLRLHQRNPRLLVRALSIQER